MAKSRCTKTLLLHWGLLAMACQADQLSGPTPTSYNSHPEKPAIIRDVAMINDNVEYTHPFVPGHRTTMDGRVAVRVQGGPPGNEMLRTQLSFFLFAPERLTASIMAGPAGAVIMSETAPFNVTFPPATEPEVMRLGHHAICDPTEEFAQPNEKPNPYACGPGLKYDCYDITIINSVARGVKINLYGTPVTVVIENPKTAQARILSVTLGQPIQGQEIVATLEYTEPAVTRDGRLLTGRFGGFPRDWTNPLTGEKFNRPYDLMYSVLPADAKPCDVTGWKDFHPFSYAPYDPNLKGRYGIADYPFRDTEGKPIPVGEDMGGTYPWVDREGANMFMTGVHGRLAEQSRKRYPRRCVTAGCDKYPENIDFDRGFMVAGAWTHGKLVHLDGLINNIDWAVGVTPSMHYWVDLYRQPDGNAVPIRFGSGRFIEAFRGIGPYPEGYTHNPNILDSLQNVANYAKAARPVTPRDVVWVMSSGVGTDEIAFDDFLDPDALIVSNMQASITQLYNEAGESTGIPKHWNGQVRTFTSLEPPLRVSVLDGDADEEIHIQNAATSLRRPVPPYGLVAAGTGRVEPVALGGVKGRGFWLSGENAIRYAIPDQSGANEPAAWYVGIFIDNHANDDATRALLTFPDGAQLRLVNNQRLQIAKHKKLIHQVDLPPANGFRHLGLRIAGDHQQITILVDGMAFDYFESKKPLFVLSAGDLIVGRTGPELAELDGNMDPLDAGARGWIDDFVVLAHDVNPEVACNHANGTLARVDNNSTWLSYAQRYPVWAHEQIAVAAGDAAGSYYVCYLDLSRDYGAHLANIPAGLTPRREAINFPEGPLRAGAPRPDSSSNPFCLSCHHAEGKSGLGLEALKYKADVLAENDPRRQPLQPPRRVFGNIPANWIPADRGPGSPAEAFVAPSDGALIDLWVLPAAE